MLKIEESNKELIERARLVLSQQYKDLEPDVIAELQSCIEAASSLNETLEEIRTKSPTLLQALQQIENICEGLSPDQYLDRLEAVGNLILAKCHDKPAA